MRSLFLGAAKQTYLAIWTLVNSLVYVDRWAFFASLQFWGCIPHFFRNTSVRIGVSIQTGNTYMLPCMYLCYPAGCADRWARLLSDDQ